MNEDSDNINENEDDYEYEEMLVTLKFPKYFAANFISTASKISIR